MTGKKLILLILISVVGILHTSIAFNYTHKEETLIGFNADGSSSSVYMWFIPGEIGSYGRMYLGFEDFIPVSGMNGQGLVLLMVPKNDHDAPGSLALSVKEEQFFDLILSGSASVKEALNQLESYDLEFLRSKRLMLTDKTGNSAILEFENILRKRQTFQILTDSGPVGTSPDPIYPCLRSRIAGNMITNRGLSQDLIRIILAATHREQGLPTQFSNLFDPGKGIVYLYHFHNFENTVRINLEEALKQGRSLVRIDKLFPDSYAYLKYSEHQPVPVFDLMTQLIERKGVEQAIAGYISIRNNPEDYKNYLFDVIFLDRIGKILLEQGNHDQAVAVFQLNAAEYPGIWLVYDSLGNALYMLGDKSRALENLNRSLEMNPENPKTSERIRALRSETEN